MNRYKCSICGKEFEGVPHFCPSCGAKFANADEVAQAEGQTGPTVIQVINTVPSQPVETGPSLESQKKHVITGFVFALVAFALLDASLSMYILRSLDVMMRVIAAPALALLAWIFAGVGNNLLNDGDYVQGGVRALKIIGKIVAIITLIFAIISTIAWAFVTAAYFLSDFLNQFVDLNLKEMVIELLTTGKFVVK